MGDHDLLERLVKAVESIALSLKVEKIATEFREGMKDVHMKTDLIPNLIPNTIAEARVPNIVSKPNGTIVQEITEVKESVNYIDVYPVNTIKHESEKAYFLKNTKGLVKCIPKQYIIDKKLMAQNPDIIERIVLVNSAKWVIEQDWKEDEYQ